MAAPDVYTYKERVADLKAREAEQRAQRLADWRARNPDATCSDRTAAALAELEAMGRGVLTRASALSAAAARSRP